MIIHSNMRQLQKAFYLHCFKYISARNYLCSSFCKVFYGVYMQISFISLKDYLITNNHKCKLLERNVIVIHLTRFSGPNIKNKFLD